MGTLLHEIVQAVDMMTNARRRPQAFKGSHLCSYLKIGPENEHLINTLIYNKFLKDNAQRFTIAKNIASTIISDCSNEEMTAHRALGLLAHTIMINKHSSTLLEEDTEHA